MADIGSAQGSAQTKNMPMNSTSQLLGALVPSASLALVLLSAFLLIRKKFPDVYDPKRRRARLLTSDEVTMRARGSFDRTAVHRRNAMWSPFLPPDSPSSLPGWLHMLWTLPDERVLVLCGADAYMFLRFLRMGLTISIPLLVIGFGVLAPLNAAGSSRNADLPQLERFSLSNVQAGSSVLWAPLVASYLFTFIVLRWLHRETAVFVDLRQRYLTSPTAQAHSLLLRDLPSPPHKPNQPRTTSTTDLLDQVRGRLLDLVLLAGGEGREEVLGIHVVSREKRGKFEALSQRKDKAISQLYRAYEVLAATGERPTHLEPSLLKALRPWDPWTRRRLFRRERLDTIEATTEKIRRINALLAGAKIRPQPSQTHHPRLQRGDSARSARSATSDRSATTQAGPEQEGASQRSQQAQWQAVWEGSNQSERKGQEADAALLTMKSPLQATALRRVPWQSARVGVLTTSEAPAPRDVIWANLGHSAWTRWLCTALVGLLVLLVILAYTIPVGFIASLANLRELAHTRGLEWLEPVLSWEPAATSLLEGFLPPLLLSVLFSLVPPLMRYLSVLQLLPSYSAAESSAITKLYAFSVLDVFLAYTIAGSLFSKLEQLSRLAGHPVEIVSLLATTMPAQSTFFTTYLIIGTLSQLPSELLRIGALVMNVVWKRCVMRRRGLWDDLELMHNTISLHYMYPFPLLVLLLGLSYAVLAPLVLLFMTLYFLLAYPVWLHQLLYVYQPSSHTGASQWPAVYRCNICSLVVHQLLLAGVLGLKKAPIQAALVVPLLVATLAYAILFYKSFASLSESPSLESLLHQQQKDSAGIKQDRAMSRWLFGGPLRTGDEETKEEVHPEAKDDVHLLRQGGAAGYGSEASSHETSNAAGRREALAKAYDPWPDKGGVGEAEQAQNAMSQDKAQPLLDPYGAIMEGCYWDADRDEIVRIFSQPLQRSILHDWLATLSGGQHQGAKREGPVSQTEETQNQKGQDKERKEKKARAGEDEWEDIPLTV